MFQKVPMFELVKATSVGDALLELAVHQNGVLLRIAVFMEYLALFEPHDVGGVLWRCIGDLLVVEGRVVVTVVLPPHQIEPNDVHLFLAEDWEHGHEYGVVDLLLQIWRRNDFNGAHKFEEGLVVFI